MRNSTPLSPVRKQPAVQVVQNRAVVLDGRVFSLQLIEDIVDATFDLLVEPRKHRKEPHRILRVLSKEFGVPPHVITALLAVYGKMHRRQAVSLHTHILNAITRAKEAKLSVVKELAS